jgi:hypothetical protein
MIHIGVVNIDTSHPKSFSAYLMQSDRARYHAVYNDGFRGDDEVEGFMKTAGIKIRCVSIHELAKIVDVGFIQNCNWDRHLECAAPFFELDKPVFIDKPVVGSMPDCKKLMELSNNGKVILGSSSVRYASEVEEFREKLDQQKSVILNIHGTAGVDEFNYGVHIVEAIDGIVKDEGLSCRYCGASRIGKATAESFFVRYKKGSTASYTICHSSWMPFSILAMTTQGTVSFDIDSSKVYGVLLDRICDHMEKGVSDLASVKELTGSVKIMLAGKISRENNGMEIFLNQIPDDYEGFDGCRFENEYSAKAAKIYI